MNEPVRSPLRLMSRAVAAFCAALLVLLPALEAGAQETPRIRLRPVAEAAPSGHAGAAPKVSQDERALSLARVTREHAAAALARVGERAAARVQAGGSSPAALERLRRDVGGGLVARFRRGAATPRWLRARVLEPAAAGLAPGPERDERTARSFLRERREVLGLTDPDRELELVRTKRDRLGLRHLLFAQRHHGLEVWPAELALHLDPAGNVESMSGAFVPTPRALVTQPAVSASEAASIAREHVAGAALETSSPDLIVYADGKTAARLAWRLDVRVSASENWRVVVDARDAAILAAFNRVTSANTAGSGLDLFGQTRSLNVWSEPPLFYMTDTSKAMFDPTSNPPQPDATRGAIIIQNADNQPPTPEPETIPPNVHVESSSSANAGLTPDAVSAATNFSDVYDYFRDVHGRNSLDDAGGSILAIVRLGLEFQNAFFDPSLNLMGFGDAVPYAGALDVVAHELTHGITFHTSNLIYQDESGALNESFSDVFGELVEARVTGGSPDWLLGSALPQPFRNMRDPSSLEWQPGSPYPERYSEYIDPGFDNGGVHINSSIINHAFYQLAEGLAGAIGLEDSAAIFFRALTLYLTQSSQFIDARLACIQSAEDLFGAGSAQALRVAEAFDFVEVFDGPGTPDPPSLPGVEGEDATLFLFYDPDGSFCTILRPDSSGGGYCLGRREGPDDPDIGVLLSAFDVAPSRPAVIGNGSLGLFVDTLFDLCFIPTDRSETESCLGLPSDGILVSSAAVSPDGNRFGFVLLDEFGQRENVIYVFDLADPEGDVLEFELRAAVLDGGQVATVLFADAMDFAHDGSFLIYDAFNEYSLANGARVGSWSIYLIDIATGATFALVPPVEGLDIAYPALAQRSDALVAFDAFDQATGQSTVYAGDLDTGELAAVGGSAGFGIPGYDGEDSAVVYSKDSATTTGFSLIRQPLAGDGITPSGGSSVWLGDADFGVVYRRGELQPPAPDCNPLCADLLGRETFSIRRVVKEKASIDLDVELRADGSWQATDAAGTSFSGTWFALGNKGRKFGLVLDASSFASLMAGLEMAVSAAAGTPVSLQAREPEKITLKLNKKRTSASLKLTLKLRGTGAGIVKNGKYKLTQMKGPVQSGP
jgi:bacillolysin